jgi:ABC-type phosphate transport system substrate-binding protein
MPRLALFLMIAAGLVAGGPWRRIALSAPAVGDRQSLAEANLAIVVNRSSPINNLSTAELRSIFLGARGHWPSGRRITIVMLEPGRPEREALLREICQMSETEFSNRILHGIFTGEVLVSPKTLADPAGVRKFVFNVPGAIGYLRASEVDDTVKVVSVDERTPFEKGYTLHMSRAAVK